MAKKGKKDKQAELSQRGAAAMARLFRSNVVGPNKRGYNRKRGKAVTPPDGV